MKINHAMQVGYLSTSDIVDDHPAHVTIRIGEQSKAVDRLLMSNRASCAAFITAWNPYSRKLGLSENRRRQAHLESQMSQKGRHFLRGYGVGDDRSWPAEESILVFNADLSTAAGIGRAWNQNAIVFLRLGRAPILVDLRSATRVAKGLNSM